MPKAEKRTRSLALYETILKLKDLDECCKFFDDLCTPTELRSLEQRFDVAVYLQQGLVYLDILEKTGASSATISRVRRSMLDNGAGGVMRDVILREGLGEPEGDLGAEGPGRPGRRLRWRPPRGAGAGWGLGNSCQAREHLLERERTRVDIFLHIS